MKRPKLPYMPWYPVDYDSDDRVQDLTELADLFYRRLLDLQWRRRGRGIPIPQPGGEPSGTTVRFTGETTDRYGVRWTELWTELSIFFVEVVNDEGDPCLRNARLHAEWEKHEKQWRQRVTASRKGVEARGGQPSGTTERSTERYYRAVQPTQNSELRDVTTTTARASGAMPDDPLGLLMGPPWNLGLAKAQIRTELGMTLDDVAAWDRFAHEHGRGAAQKLMERYRHPSMVPVDPAATVKSKPRRPSAQVGDEW